MDKVVEKYNVFYQMLTWWLVETPGKILLAWKNFLLFNLNYFSVTLLLKTFFSPWRRYQVSSAGGFNLGKYTESLVSNLIFRILGAFFRSFLIISGLVVEAVILCLGAIVFMFWILFPFIVIGAAVLGVKLLV